MTAAALEVVDVQVRLRWCVYCGGRCYRGRTCEGHRDLPELERQMYTPRDQWARLRKRAA